jgi:hypothetical protein
MGTVQQQGQAGNFKLQCIQIPSSRMRDSGSHLTQPVKIFRAYAAPGYVPLSWRMVRLIFIPKPGNTG